MGELFGSDRVGIYGGTVVAGLLFECFYFVAAVQISFINHPSVKKGSLNSLDSKSNQRD